LIRRERVPVAINDERGIDGNRSLYSSKRDGTIFEVIARGRHDTNLLTIEQDCITGHGEFGIRSVQVQANQSPRWVPDVVNLCNSFLTCVTPLR
jgi:hypothetical protein